MAFNEDYYKEKKAKIDAEYQAAKDEYIKITMTAAADLQDKLQASKAKYAELEARVKGSQDGSTGPEQSGK